MSIDARSRGHRYLGIALRGGITLAILAYLVYKIDWVQLARQLGQADHRWLLLASFFFGLTYLLAALRWWLLLRVQDIHLPLRVVGALTLIGQFFNTFMLGSVGGDLMRAIYVQRYAPGRRTHATLSVVMDRVLGLSVLLCGSLLALPWQMHAMMSTDKARAAIIGLMIVLGLIVIGTIAIAIVP